MLSAMTQQYFWSGSFQRIYEAALARFQDGVRGEEAVFSEEDVEILASWGLCPIHVYDWIEDVSGGGDPDFPTALLIAAVRRDYFLYELGGRWPGFETAEASLPLREDCMGGIPWLPRILAKARCFLEGHLCHDVMYYCGGDRAFLRKHDLHAADFLRFVWASRGDDGKILRLFQHPPEEFGC